MSGRTESRLTEEYRGALRGLPELEPPAALEYRTRAAMAAAMPARGSWLAQAAGLLVVLGVGAVLGLRLLDHAPGPEAGRDVREVSDTRLGETRLAGEAAGAASAAASADAPEANLARLSAQSALLEQALAELPPPRPVVRVSTLGTILGLEDRLALIDAELDQVAPAASDYRVALLQNRVEVMNALVNVRYAQSRPWIY